MRIFAIRFERNSVLTREHSSVGLEHLPYKQRVGGSTPSAPTKSLSSFLERLFSCIYGMVLVESSRLYGATYCLGIFLKKVIFVV